MIFFFFTFHLHIFSCLWKIFSAYEMSYQWNVLSMKCPIYEMSYLYKVLSLKCPIYEMSYLRNVLSMKCPIYIMSYHWNVLSMKCPIYEMSYLWNVGHVFLLKRQKYSWKVPVFPILFWGFLTIHTSIFIQQMQY